MVERELAKNEVIVGVTGDYALRRIRNQCGRLMLLRLVTKKSSQYAATTYFIVRRNDAFDLIGKKDIRECGHLKPAMFDAIEDETKISKKHNYLQGTLFE